MPPLELSPAWIVAWMGSILVGLALGLLGGGGSLLLVPLLVYVLGIAPHPAVALSLVVVLVTSLSALVPHARRGVVDVRAGFSFGAASTVGALLGSAVSALIPGGVLLAGLAVVMIASALGLRTTRATPRASAESPIRAALVGAATGVVTGLVGAGGGFVVVPALVLFLGLPVERAAPTSLLVIALNSAAALVGHASTLPWSDVPALFVVLALAVVGALVGAQIAPRVAPARLRRAFVWLVLGVAVFVLGRELVPLAGLGTSAALVAALGALAALVFVVGTLADPPADVSSTSVGQSP